MTARHEFETLSGDELSEQDLWDATWQVHFTFVDIDQDIDQVVFTHRVSVHHLDDLTISAIDPEDN